MRIAIIGSGISGLVAAYHLQREHSITVFEANDYIGGHTDTHILQTESETVAVDSGFIVFNQENYPRFSALLNELNIESQPSNMSFSVSNHNSGLEYNAANLDTLFCQRRNLLNPGFYKMIADIKRFYKESPALLKSESDISLGAYLNNNHYSSIFKEAHLYPMACALWSAAPEIIGQFPARYLVAFMQNHKMLQVNDRPEWRTVAGGSSVYIKALARNFQKQIRLNTPVHSVVRKASGVTIVSEKNRSEQFDKVFFACHSDQALALLQQANKLEQEVLGAIRYQRNEMTLHSDSSLMPLNKKAWASWNVQVSKQQTHYCSVTYYMNLLQSLKSETDFFVSLNPVHTVDPQHIWKQRIYHHPIYTKETLRAQKRFAEINGQQHSYFCGAYWGWGFHEDGVRSALNALDIFNEDKRLVA